MSINKNNQVTWANFMPGKTIKSTKYTKHSDALIIEFTDGLVLSIGHTVLSGLVICKEKDSKDMDNDDYKPYC